MNPRLLISHFAVLILGIGIGLLINSQRNVDPDNNSEKDLPPIEKDTIETKPQPKDTAPVIVPLPPSDDTDPCFASEEQFSTQLSLFAEQMEGKHLWYDFNNPNDFLDNSGIFHRAVAFVKSKCNQYDYPGQDQRGIKVPKWYAARNELRVIKSQEDGLARRDLIKPGSVMFFGQSGQTYNKLTLNEVTTDGVDKVIDHIGVVTAVNKDAQGKVEGYVMLHGRGDGKIAQRTHYHSILPAGFGMPPLGNYNQQWVAIADIRTPHSDLVEQSEPTVEGIIPTNPGSVNLVAENIPNEDEMSCFNFDFDEFFFNDVIKVLEDKKIPYKQEDNSDCSGIVYRVCNQVSGNTPRDCVDNFVVPCESGYKDSRKLARWYYEQKNLNVVTDPQSMGDLIQVGAVMFYGQYGKPYGKNISIDDLEINGKGIQHVGVVVKVNKEDDKVVSYELFHGHGDRGDPADITKPHKGLTSVSQIHTNDRKAFSYYGQQWVAIAPHILTSADN